MKTFSTFDRPGGWDTAHAAFADDLAAGHRIQVAPWGGLAVLGHGALIALARDPLADGMAPGPVSSMPQVARLLNRAVFTQSGAGHRRNRAALVAALDAVDVLALVGRALQGVRPLAPVDLREGLVAPLVRGVWGGLVGHDDAEARAAEAAVADLARVLSPVPDPDGGPAAEAAAGALRDLTRQALGTGTPFARRLVDAVGPEAAVDLIAGMAFDGIETAATGLTGALRVAAAHPGLIAATPACATECLRLASPAPLTMRLATGDIRLDDLTIPAGTVLAMVWAAGNHDPQAFADPGRFDPARFGPGRGAARMLSFGMGGHACLGHGLVRAMLLAVLDVLTRGDLRLTGDPGGWHPFRPQDLPALTVTA